MIHRQRNLLQRIISSPIFQSALIFCGVIIGTALIEGTIIIVLVLTHLFSLLLFLSHWSFLIMGAIILNISAAALVVSTAQLRSIKKYRRLIRQKQLWLRNVYIPLSFLPDVYETSSVVQDNNSYATQTLQDIVERQGEHFLLLGQSGVGATTALRMYQYNTLEHISIRKNDKIPLFLSLKNYNTFLRNIAMIEETQEYDENDEFISELIKQASLMEYLYTSKEEGLQHLHPYLRKWFKQGRIAFLCDGLHEVDSQFLPALCQEITDIMQNSENRCFITCRERYYHEQPFLANLVGNEYAREALIMPLQPAQIDDFVGSYINSGITGIQNDAWTRTVDEVIKLIDSTNLRTACTQPFLLLALMRTINVIEVHRRQEFNTKGLLLRECVSQLIQRGLVLQNKKEQTITEEEMIFFRFRRVYCLSNEKFSRHPIREPTLLIRGG